MKIYRPVTVLVGVGFVLLGGLVRLGLPEQLSDHPHKRVVRTSIGAPIVQDDFTLTVTRVRAAEAVIENPDRSDEKPLRTDGIFVAVEYEVAGRGEEGRVGDAELKSGDDTTYQAAKDIIAGVDIPPPGFTQTGTFVYEVNPDDMAELTMWVDQSLFWNVTANLYAIDLGIPSDAAAEELVAGAAKEYVIPKETLRVTS